MVFIKSVMVDISSRLVLNIKLDIESGMSEDVRRGKICIRMTVKALGEWEITSK